MQRRHLNRLFALLLPAIGLLSTLPASAQDEAPDAMIKRLCSEMLEGVKSDKSLQADNLSRITALVDEKIMPNLDFQRMTASAVGPQWSSATPEQQKSLQNEFKILLVRIYAGALSQINDRTIVVRPLRASPEDREVVVRTEVRGRGDPIQLDYRLEKTSDDGSGWRIYNLNVLGVWLVETYKSQFVEVVNSKGIDGLIDVLSQRNKSNSRKS